MDNLLSFLKTKFNIDVSNIDSTQKVLFIHGQNFSGKTKLLHSIANTLNTNGECLICDTMTREFGEALIRNNDRIIPFVSELFGTTNISRHFSNVKNEALKELLYIIAILTDYYNEPYCFIDNLGDGLHIDSQRRIVQMLLKSFPNVTFITVTNHPAIVGNLSGNMIPVEYFK